MVFAEDPNADEWNAGLMRTGRREGILKLSLSGGDAGGSENGEMSRVA